MLLIKNGRVMDPKSGLDQVCDVLVEGKNIVKIGQNLEAADAQVLDASGLVVAPGLVDMCISGSRARLIRKIFIRGLWQQQQVALRQLL